MMYAVTIKNVYVPAASPEMAIRQAARTLKNGRMITSHPESIIEVGALRPNEGEPEVFLSGTLKSALPHGVHKPNRDEQGHFIEEAS